MTTDHRDIVESLLTAARNGDFETVVNLTHPECRIVEADSLPYGGVYEGPEAYKDLILDLLDAWEDVEITPTNVVSSGVDTIVRMEFTGSATATDEMLTIPILESYRVKDGLVKNVEVFYRDTAKVLETLGRS